MNNLALVGEKHAGDAHCKNDDSNDAACAEMAPENNFAKAHATDPVFGIMRLPSAAADCGRRR
jgi:hypothetical protein